MKKVISGKPVAIQVFEDGDHDHGIEEIKLSSELVEFLLKNPVCGRSDYTNLPGAKQDIQSPWRLFQYYPRRQAASHSHRSPSTLSEAVSEERRRKFVQARLQRQQRHEQQLQKKQELAARRHASYLERKRVAASLERTSIANLNDHDRPYNGEKSNVVIISSPRKKQLNRHDAFRRASDLKHKKAKERANLFCVIKAMSNNDEKSTDKDISGCTLDSKFHLKALINEVASIDYVPPDKLNLKEEEDWVIKKLTSLRNPDSSLEAKSSSESWNNHDSSVSSSSSPKHKHLPILTTLVKRSTSQGSNGSDDSEETWSIVSSSSHQNSSVKAVADSSTGRRMRRRKERINYFEWEEYDDLLDDEIIKYSSPASGDVGKSQQIEEYHEGSLAVRKETLESSSQKEVISNTGIEESVNIKICSKSDAVTSSVNEVNTPLERIQFQVIVSSEPKKEITQTEMVISQCKSEVAKKSRIMTTSDTKMNSQASSSKRENSHSNKSKEFLAPDLASPATISLNLLSNTVPINTNPASSSQHRTNFLVDPGLPLPPTHHQLSCPTMLQNTPPNFLIPSQQNVSNDMPQTSFLTFQGNADLGVSNRNQHQRFATSSTSSPVNPLAIPHNVPSLTELGSVYSKSALLHPPPPLLACGPPDMNFGIGDILLTGQPAVSLSLNPETVQSRSLSSFALSHPVVSKPLPFCVDLEPIKKPIVMTHPNQIAAYPEMRSDPRQEVFQQKPTLTHLLQLQQNPYTPSPTVQGPVNSLAHVVSSRMGSFIPGQAPLGNMNLTNPSQVNVNSGIPRMMSMGHALSNQSLPKAPSTSLPQNTSQRKHPVTMSNNLGKDSVCHSKSKRNNDTGSIKELSEASSKEEPLQKVPKISHSSKEKSLKDIDDMLNTINCLPVNKSVALKDNLKPKSNSPNEVNSSTGKKPAPVQNNLNPPQNRKGEYSPHTNLDPCVSRPFASNENSYTNPQQPGAGRPAPPQPLSPYISRPPLNQPHNPLHAVSLRTTMIDPQLPYHQSVPLPSYHSVSTRLPPPALQPGPQLSSQHLAQSQKSVPPILLPQPPPSLLASPGTRPYPPHPYNSNQQIQTPVRKNHHGNANSSSQNPRSRNTSEKANSSHQLRPQGAATVRGMSGPPSSKTHHSSSAQIEKYVSHHIQEQTLLQSMQSSNRQDNTVSRPKQPGHDCQHQGSHRTSDVGHPQPRLCTPSENTIAYGQFNLQPRIARTDIQQRNPSNTVRRAPPATRPPPPYSPPPRHPSYHPPIHLPTVVNRPPSEMSVISASSPVATVPVCGTIITHSSSQGRRDNEFNKGMIATNSPQPSSHRVTTASVGDTTKASASHDQRHILKLVKMEAITSRPQFLQNSSPSSDGSTSKAIDRKPQISDTISSSSSRVGPHGLSSSESAYSFSPSICQSPLSSAPSTSSTTLVSQLSFHTSCLNDSSTSSSTSLEGLDHTESSSTSAAKSTLSSAVTSKPFTSTTSSTAPRGDRKPSICDLARALKASYSHQEESEDDDWHEDSFGYTESEDEAVDIKPVINHSSQLSRVNHQASNKELQTPVSHGLTDQVMEATRAPATESQNSSSYADDIMRSLSSSVSSNIQAIKANLSNHHTNSSMVASILSRIKTERGLASTSSLTSLCTTSSLSSSAATEASSSLPLPPAASSVSTGNENMQGFPPQFSVNSEMEEVPSNTITETCHAATVSRCDNSDKFGEQSGKQTNVSSKSMSVILGMTSSPATCTLAVISSEISVSSASLSTPLSSPVSQDVPDATVKHNVTDQAPLGCERASATVVCHSSPSTSVQVGGSPLSACLSCDTIVSPVCSTRSIVPHTNAEKTCHVKEPALTNSNVATYVETNQYSQNSELIETSTHSLVAGAIMLESEKISSVLLSSSGLALTLTPVCSGVTNCTKSVPETKVTYTVNRPHTSHLEIAPVTTSKIAQPPSTAQMSLTPLPTVSVISVSVSNSSSSDIATSTHGTTDTILRQQSSQQQATNPCPHIMSSDMLVSCATSITSPDFRRTEHSQTVESTTHLTLSQNEKIWSKKESPDQGTNNINVLSDPVPLIPFTSLSVSLKQFSPATMTATVVSCPFTSSSSNTHITFGQSDLICDLIRVKTELSEDTSESANELFRSGIIMSGGEFSSSKSVIIDATEDSQSDTNEQCSEDNSLSLQQPDGEETPAPADISTDDSELTLEVISLENTSALNLEVSPTVEPKAVETLTEEIQSCDLRSLVICQDSDTQGRSELQIPAVVIPPPKHMANPISLESTENIRRISSISLSTSLEDETNAWQVGSHQRDDAQINAADLFANVVSPPAPTSTVASVSAPDSPNQYSVVVCSQYPNVVADSKDGLKSDILKTEVNGIKVVCSVISGQSSAQDTSGTDTCVMKLEQMETTLSPTQTSVIVSASQETLPYKEKSNCDSINLLGETMSQSELEPQDQSQSDQSPVKENVVQETTEPCSSFPPEKGQSETTNNVTEEDQAEKETEFKIEDEDDDVCIIENTGDGTFQKTWGFIASQAQTVTPKGLANTSSDSIIVLSDDGDDNDKVVSVENCDNDEIIIYDDSPTASPKGADPMTKLASVLVQDESIGKDTGSSNQMVAATQLVQTANSNPMEDTVSTISSSSSLSGGSNVIRNRSINALGSWSKEKVSAWLKKNKLDKICLNLSNLDGPGLQRMAFECHRDHEVFYSRVKKSLGLTMFNTLVIIRSLRSLIQQDEDDIS